MKRYFTLLFAFCLAVVPAFAQSDDRIPERPDPPRLVNDLATDKILSADEEARLEQKLESFANSTSNQVVIVVADDFGGLEPYEYATALGRKWGVGQSKENNGIIILVKPTGGSGERKAFIATGLGLEGAIPDATAKEITENELIPNFKNKDYYKGLDQATDVIMALAKGEYDSDAYAKKHTRNRVPVGLILAIAVIVIIVMIRRGGGNRGGGGLSMGTGFLLGSMMGRRSGGWGGGGGSSGGFGGFGGGSFGGGGAGGSW